MDLPPWLGRMTIIAPMVEKGLISYGTKLRDIESVRQMTDDDQLSMSDLVFLRIPMVFVRVVGA